MDKRPVKLISVYKGKSRTYTVRSKFKAQALALACYRALEPDKFYQMLFKSKAL